MFKQTTLIAIILALLLFGYVHGASVYAVDNVTLPESLELSGLLLDNPQRDDGFLSATNFGQNTLLIGAKNTIVEFPQIVLPVIPTEPIQVLPTAAPIATPALTLTPTETPTPIITVSPQHPIGLNADKLFTLANNYRKSLGLNELLKDDRTCALANARAPEIGAEIANGTMHSGMRARNLPFWNSENIISMGSEDAAFNWWIHDQIHKEAIEGAYTYSCVACAGYSCVQEFTNFSPK